MKSLLKVLGIFLGVSLIVVAFALAGYLLEIFKMEPEIGIIGTAFLSVGVSIFAVIFGLIGFIVAAKSIEGGF